MYMYVYNAQYMYNAYENISCLFPSIIQLFPLDSKKHTEFLSVISVKGAKIKEEKKRNGFTIYPCIKEMTYM